MLPKRPDPSRPEPLVVSTLREYREALEAREMDASLRMARSWLTIERQLEADIAALAQEFARRRDAGEVITQQMVWRAERYQIIKAKLAEEVTRWSKGEATALITAEQRAFGQLGVDAARDAITASYGGALRAPYFPVLNPGAVETMAGFLGNGSPLYTLLKQSYPDAVEGLANALLQGIGRGLGPSATAKLMADGMGMGLERALLISRTETNRAYRLANIQAYRHSGVVSGFMRLVKKPTACVACLMLDGQRFDVAEELSDHPRGKCVAICVCMGAPLPRWQTGPAWFNTLTPEEQRAKMGGEKYELWKAGAFQLSDLARMSHSDVWGDAPRVATVKELTGGE